MVGEWNAAGPFIGSPRPFETSVHFWISELGSHKEKAGGEKEPGGPQKRENVKRGLITHRGLHSCHGDGAAGE